MCQAGAVSTAVRPLFALFTLLVLVAGCGGTTATGTPVAVPTGPARATTAPVLTSPAPSSSTGAPMSTWRVGASPLPIEPDGLGEVEPTPAQLVNRRLPTTDFLPPPTDGRYHSTVSAVPAAVLARSTWQAACPVPSSALAYLTMSFRGFDGRAHTGEMLVNASIATKVTQVFGALFAEKFPIEEMRVTTNAEQAAPPTGDGNDTADFVCRPAVGQTNWSSHAYGLAVDVNPFCNPYHKGAEVVPELASAYLDRGYVRPGMILPGDATVRAFTAIGWTWGGIWTSPQDLMHFSANGR
jgi:hypothetical protein